MGDGAAQSLFDVHCTHEPFLASQMCALAVAQSWFVWQLKQIARTVSHVGALEGHAPPSAHVKTQVLVTASHDWPLAQSASTPQATHWWRATSQRAVGAVQSTSSTHAKH
jgi:hypothetical protein